MKVVFLDFDGVLNSVRWYQTGMKESQCALYYAKKIDPAAVGLLNQLVDRTGASVVISSTWRRFADDVAVRTLRARGFMGQIIGKTPELSTFRGLEIQSWLSTPPVPVESFVILDDENDMVHLEHRLVQTSFQLGGLQDVHVERAIQILSLSIR